MLFMSIFTYDPENRDEVLAKRMEGLNVPEGAKLINQWSSVAGGCAFTLFETDNPMVIAGWFSDWNSLGTFEILPVVETEELMTAMRSK